MKEYILLLAICSLLLCNFAPCASLNTHSFTQFAFHQPETMGERKRNISLQFAPKSMQNKENSQSSVHPGDRTTSRRKLRQSLKASSFLRLRGGAFNDIVSALSSISTELFGQLPLPLATSDPLTNDILVSSSLVIEVYIWLKFWTTLAQKKILPSVLTRKIIHAGSAPLFVLHWPLFSQTAIAPYIAAGIPALQMLRLYLAGSGGLRKGTVTKASNTVVSEGGEEAPDSELIAAVSRTGRREEALGGPFLYSIVLFVATICCFRSNAAGVVAIAQMAAGDGLADIVGRQFGKDNKWPWSQRKSIAGSLGFVLGGWFCSWTLLRWLQYTGFLSGLASVSSSGVVLTLLGISLLCALVELFPIVDDNISVPVVAAVATYLLLPISS